MTFSIIIPVYNVAPYLRACLDSVLAQTYTDWEAICVDDGSSDGSGAILDEYATKDSRFKVIHQKNAGVSAARNAALDVAHGEWTLFVDADDYLLADHIDTFVARKERADINFLPVRFLNDDGSVRFCCGPVSGVVDKSADIERHVRALLFGDTGSNLLGYTWNKFIRSSLIRNGHVRFVTGLSVSEDEVFAFACLEHARSISVLPGTGYCYRWHKSGLTHCRFKDYDLLSRSFVALAEAMSTPWLRAVVLLRSCEAMACKFGQERSLKAASELIRHVHKFSMEDSVLGRKGRLIRHYRHAGCLVICFYYLFCSVTRSCTLHFDHCIGLHHFTDNLT